MLSPNARKTTYLFLIIILITVLFDVFVQDRSFSHVSQKNYSTADATHSSWFWKK